MDEETLALFDVDKNHLVEEFTVHPKRYGTCAHRLAEARKDVGEADAALAVVKAELTLRFRKDPERYGFPKATDSVVDAYVISHSRFRTAQAAVLAAKHKMNLLQAAVNTLEQRKACIEALLKLLLGEFWAMPKLPNEIKANLSRERRTRV